MSYCERAQFIQVKTYFCTEDVVTYSEYLDKAKSCFNQKNVILSLVQNNIFGLRIRLQHFFRDSVLYTVYSVKMCPKIRDPVREYTILKIYVYP
jgi:hypothetical protein